MKFAQKLALTMVLVLAVSFSLGGTVLLYGIFFDALQTAAGQSEGQHALACYALENDLRALSSRGEALTVQHLAAYGTAQTGYLQGTAQYLALQQTLPDNQSGTPTFSTFPWEEPLEALPSSYRVRRNEGHTYLVFKSALQPPQGTEVWLMTAYDVTSVFAARSRSIWRFWWLELAVLLCAAIAAIQLSRWLTKPLQALTAASESIAQGAYTQRTGVHGQDEIGRLSQSFDIMAAAVEMRVQALELSVRQRDDFIAAFTHELKTPMTAILGYADTLRTMQCEPRTQQQAANYIFAESKRIEALSQKLLALLELSDKAVKLEPVRLDVAFCKAKVALAPMGASVELHFAQTKDIVLADMDLLLDLLYNLVHNAIKASELGDVVQILCTATIGGVRISVKDNGCGILPKQLARVTEPFFMVDKSRARKNGGSGMGLAVCQKIAEVHGTQLELFSVPSKGTSVSFVLQTVESEEQA